MKKLFFIAIAGILAIAGCTREVPEIMNGTRTELTAGREAGPATRSELNEDGENLWSVGDKILVGWAGGKMAPFSSKETEPTETARFTGLLYTNNSGDDTLYGIYPAEEGNAVEKDGSYTLKFHAEQNAVAGSYDPEAFLAVAQTTDKSLAFYNVLGLLKFQVAAENVRKITLKPGATAVEPEDDPEVDPEEDEEDDPMITPPEHIEEGEGEDEEEPEEPEVIAEPVDPGFIPGGILTVEGKTPEIKEYSEELDAIVLKGPGGKNFAPETDYYMAVPPCVLENGVTFELLYSDGSKGIVSLEGSKEVERSKIHDVGVLEGNAEPEPEPEEPDFNGVEYVEMAPGLFFATCNVGAESPEEAGNYYAWADPNPKTDDADYDNYLYYDMDEDSITKYNSEDGMTCLADADYEDDPARLVLGGDWRTPRYFEWDFLCDSEYFEWVWTDTEYDEETGEVISLGGYTVISHVEGCEGNSIFLPAAGVVWEDYSGGLNHYGEYGYYWSADMDEGYDEYGYLLFLYEYSHYSDNDYWRFYGRSVRGVCGEAVKEYETEGSDISVTPFQSVGLYHSEGEGYSMLFLDSEWPEDGLYYYNDEPECLWLGMDIPEDVISPELDLTTNLNGSYWTFYMGWKNGGKYFCSGPSYFNSGTLKITIDEEEGTITMTIEAETIDGCTVNCSYSGPFINCSDFPCSYNWPYPDDYKYWEFI